MTSRKKGEALKVERTCGNCRYWLDQENGCGFCRRYPPKPDDKGINCYFPDTCEDEWCGEWADRDDIPLEQAAKEVIG
jgi:hypothetical protein